MSAQPLALLTIEQYLESESASTIRHEFYRGQMYAMSGGSLRHALIISNACVALGNLLRDKPCMVLTSDMRTVAGELITYPDIEVICGEPQFLARRTDTVTNPVAIFEVLSPSTEPYDRGLKAQQYRNVPSLREYAVISQTEPRIELFRRGANGWLLIESLGVDQSCHLESLGCELPLAEIYRRITFDPKEAPHPPAVE
jgi:Uma2 family endonuclease